MLTLLEYTHYLLKVLYHTLQIDQRTASTGAIVVDWRCNINRAGEYHPRVLRLRIEIFNQWTFGMDTAGRGPA